MKQLLAASILFLLHLTVHAQDMDSTGASHVGFSVDADTRVGFQKISRQHPDSTFHHDDWFRTGNYTGRGLGVIDTTGAAALTASLQARPNQSFTRRMSLAPYAVVPFAFMGNTPIAARFWVDAVYFRDNAVGEDSTSFTGSKNGDDPNAWQGTISQVADKTDIIDVFTHVRTSGTRPTIDSVWFFAGVATVGTNGSRYFDIEVYRENISYNPVTRRFTSAGTSSGHSEWTFDASGRVIQTGDIIISVTYSAGRAPEIDFRVWVSNSTYNNIIPQAFKFGSRFNSNGTAGYAQILSNSGTANWGSGVANYTTNNATTDSTFATPWGTINTSKVWSQNYDKLQFVEVALNFSRFGMNPFAYVTSFCKSPYASILIKSRTSAEFNSSLSDFVGPVNFTVKDVAPFTLRTDTLTCAKTNGAIQINATARNYYRLYDLEGNQLLPETDQPTLPVNRAGTYVLEATNFQACTSLRRDTVIVASDRFPPIASIHAFPPDPYHRLLGGDVNASNYNTPFGGSAGLLWHWTGPNGFIGSTQNVNVDTVAGRVFNLMVTERRNGCTATATFDFTTLQGQRVLLKGTSRQNSNVLNWNRPAEGAWFYHVERSQNGSTFERIATIGPAQDFSLSFTDEQPGSQAQYRILCLRTGSAPVYSNTVLISGNEYHKQINVLRTAGSANIELKVAGQLGAFQVRITDLVGRMVHQQHLDSRNGTRHLLSLPDQYRRQHLLVALYKDGKLLWAEKK